jgi:hypothetical protein
LAKKDGGGRRLVGVLDCHDWQECLKMAEDYLDTAEDP